MKYKIQEIPKMDLADFADHEMLEVSVFERPLPENDPSRFYAYFDDTEVKDRGCLVGAYGNGATPEEAISEYADSISLKTLVKGAYTKDRREIIVPRLSFNPQPIN